MRILRIRIRIPNTEENCQGGMNFLPCWVPGMVLYSVRAKHTKMLLYLVENREKRVLFYVVEHKKYG
jgi:hypothetical protein